MALYDVRFLSDPVLSCLHYRNCPSRLSVSCDSSQRFAFCPTLPSVTEMGILVWDLSCGGVQTLLRTRDTVAACAVMDNTTAPYPMTEGIPLLIPYMTANSSALHTFTGGW